MTGRGKRARGSAVRGAGAMLLIGLSLAACNSSNKIAFDDSFFRSNLSKIDGQRDVFSVTVRPASASLEGAREAGRFEAVKHCVNTYGSSDIVWQVSPDVPDEELVIENDVLTLRGACADA